MKPVQTITVEGVGLLGRPLTREYRIGFVSNWFSVSYFELRQEILKAQQAYYDMTDAQDKLREGKITPDEALKVVESAKDVINRTGTREFFERRLDLVKEILEINGQEYDRATWERRTSPTALIAFLDSVYGYGVKAEEPHGVEKPKKQRK